MIWFSDNASVTVCPFYAEELLLELGRREQEFRQEFERLIDMQERLRSDLLSAANVFGRGQDGAQVDLTPVARRQRQISRQVTQIRSQFQRIYDEMMINQLATPQVKERLIDSIVWPLEALAKRRLAEIGDTIEAYKLVEVPRRIPGPTDARPPSVSAGTAS